MQHVADPTWKLTLDLVASDGNRQGTLILQRYIADRPLRIDVNLLINSAFPAELANALLRCAHVTTYANTVAIAPSVREASAS
jgi:hypothetical protein